jgi:hypothetical protein
VRCSVKGKDGLLHYWYVILQIGGHKLCVRVWAYRDMMLCQ